MTGFKQVTSPAADAATMAGATANQGTAQIKPSTKTAAEALRDVGKVGQRVAVVGNVLTTINGAVDLANGAPIPETVGKTGGSILGGGGAWMGAGVGMAVGGPPGALIGAGIGALAGSKGGEWVGGKVGSAARGLGRGIKSLFS